MKVLCKLNNASELINGVKFQKTDKGMLSDSLDEAVARQFEGIPGYELISEQTAKPAAEKPGAEKAAIDKAAK